MPRPCLLYYKANGKFGSLSKQIDLLSNQKVSDINSGGWDSEWMGGDGEITGGSGDRFDSGGGNFTDGFENTASGGKLTCGLWL